MSTKTKKRMTKKRLAAQEARRAKIASMPRDEKGRLVKRTQMAAPTASFRERDQAEPLSKYGFSSKEDFYQAATQQAESANGGRESSTSNNVRASGEPLASISTSEAVASVKGPGPIFWLVMLIIVIGFLWMGNEIRQEVERRNNLRDISNYDSTTVSGAHTILTELCAQGDRSACRHANKLQDAMVMGTARPLY